MDLRTGLGEYCTVDGQRFPPGHLTLHDLAELIRRAGKAAGFVVQSEFKVKCGEQRRKVDWVWLDSESRRPIVAFEIEGRYVNPRSQRRDLEKFTHCGAQINVLVMFQVDHNHSPKKTRECTPHDWVRRHFAEWRDQYPVKVLLDCELMAPGGIEELQREAKSAGDEDDQSRVAQPVRRDSSRELKP